MLKILRIATFLLIVSTFLAACNFPLGRQNVTPTLSDEAIVAQTVSALQTALAVNTTPASPELSTATPSAAATVANPTQALPTGIPQPTSTSAPTYKAGYITDVTIPDNTIMEPGETFRKTWRLRNDGTATWNSKYKVVFISGDAMGGPATKEIGQTVAPGQTIDISVDLTAPATPKTYVGNWMLQTDNGVNFGIGPSATSTFWVKIVVQQFFAVTKAEPAVLPVSFTGPCPAELSLTATITTTAAGDVTYYFKTSLGDTTTQKLVFSKADTLTTPVTKIMVPSTSAFTVQVYIDNPNHQLFPTVITVPVNCQ